MCGIAGIISPDRAVLNYVVLKNMAGSLAHRGPDGEGLWINKNHLAGLAHRRLSIIDLSAAAAQPMHYLNQYSIVYNGEIYNYIELKRDLQKSGYHFNTSSDTEVILAAYDCYKERCLQYFDGMFSFAIWDEKEQILFAARDRFGEKPFYYYYEKDIFAFASEMKALWAAGIEKVVENKMILNYISLGYVQNPANKSQTFYKNIFSLPPAHYLTLNVESGHLVIENYWDIDKQAQVKINEEDAIRVFDELFTTSVSRRLRSDVPIGASLSGGLDSSSIVYYIQKLLAANPGNLKTFSAIFPGFEKDEGKYVQQVASTFKLESHTCIPSAEELVKDFEKLCYHQEEPFPSSSIYAQYKVFELAKTQNIKVLLDGQGADEILAGYHKYIHWYLQEMVSRNKFSGATKERQLLHKNNADFHWGIKNMLAAFLPSHASIALEKKEYNKIIHNPDITKQLMGYIKGREWEGIHKPVVTKLNDILYFNTMQSGLEELLRYSDRNAMAHGREVRLPFLYDEMVQFLFSLPSKFKINNGYTKSILRKLMDDKLPHNIVWRTDKIGYEPPQKQWMENPLMKDYLYEAKSKLVKEDILKPQVLAKKARGHHAHDADSFDWRYLCVAQMLHK
ncbi:MAG: asparagine synthase (glutamine-hydrolyzing) [Ferruginibacter sp.]